MDEMQRIVSLFGNEEFLRKLRAVIDASDGEVAKT